MAWFHKSLEDFERAINENNWKEARKILDQHKSQDQERTEHELKEAARLITDYYSNLEQMSTGLRILEKSGREHDKSLLRGKVHSAKDLAFQFERLLQVVMREGKFLE